MLKRNVLLALVALLIAAGSAYAQSVEFSVPFQFTVGTTEMPAGDYSIKSASGPWRMLIIQGLDRQTARSRFLNYNSVKSFGVQDQTKLVFHCYGGLCFLSQIWTEGNDVGRQLMEGRQERLVAKHDPALRVPVLAALP
jgi:hypothetical protein